MDRLIADYGEQVDYQGKGRVNREHIRSDHLGYFRDWPERHYQITGKIDVSDTLTKDIKEAKFNYTYEVRKATGRRAGWAADTWLISVNVDRFLIVSEQETVDKGSQER